MNMTHDGKPEQNDEIIFKPQPTRTIRGLRNEMGNPIVIAKAPIGTVVVKGSVVNKIEVKPQVVIKRVTLKNADYIGDNAFGGLKNLSHVKLPKTVRTIGKNLFNPCSEMVIKYPCSKIQWEQIRKSPDWAKGCQSIQIECTDGIIKIKNK